VQRQSEPLITLMNADLRRSDPFTQIYQSASRTTLARAEARDHGGDSPA
jgi:hypothetical protein